MAKSKINVTSNKLDQAPKTRAAGYGKVVDSMRKEMTEAMNGVNVPNTILNKSDQAPKTRAAGYEERVLKPLQDEINKKMDTIYMHWNDSICDFINNFLGQESNEFILQSILNLSPWDSLSFEIKREKIEYKWWRKSIWHPAFMWNFDNFIHNFYWKSENWPLKPWEVSTAIVVKKDINDPKVREVHAEQLELPGKWAFLSQWIFFHNPNIEDEEFKEIVWTEHKKEEIKEQIEENINEEIELEEKEEKINEEKRESLGDKIMWWFK